MQRMRDIVRAYDIRHRGHAFLHAASGGAPALGDRGATWIAAVFDSAAPGTDRRGRKYE